MTPPRLPAATRLGFVHLTVGDLARSLDFYRGVLGFELHRLDGDTAHLGAGATDLLVLSERPGARHVPRRTGLYHYAILVPTRADLGRALARLLERGVRLDGGSDHLVSEALYLRDPDGNGIEIYRDRPRAEWQVENGGIRMATLPLDGQGLLDEADGAPGAEDDGLPPGTALGHIHLHVADLAAAEAFYTLLGFERMARLAGSASFLAAGGYHHHVGINTWAGVGAPPPPDDATGLRYVTVELPDAEALEALTARLAGAEVACAEGARGLRVADPSGNALLFRTPATPGGSDA